MLETKYLSFRTSWSSPLQEKLSLNPPAQPSPATASRCLLLISCSRGGFSPTPASYHRLPHPLDCEFMRLRAMCTGVCVPRGWCTFWPKQVTPLRRMTVTHEGSDAVYLATRCLYCHVTWTPQTQHFKNDSVWIFLTLSVIWCWKSNHSKTVA